MLAKLRSSIVLLGAQSQVMSLWYLCILHCKDCYIVIGRVFTLVGSSICQLSNKWPQRPASSKGLATCLRMGNFLLLISFLWQVKCCIFKHLLSTLIIHHALCLSFEAVVKCNIFFTYVSVEQADMLMRKKTAGAKTTHTKLVSARMTKLKWMKKRLSIPLSNADRYVPVLLAKQQ